MNVRPNRGGARKELLNSSDHLALAVDAAGMGVWDWDVKSGQVVLSERLLTIHGFDRAPFGGTYRAYIDCIHPVDRRVFADRVVRAIQDRTDLDVEYRILLSSGGIRWVAAKGRPRYDANGELVEVVGLGTDVTTKKRNPMFAESAADNTLDTATEQYLPYSPRPRPLIQVLHPDEARLESGIPEAVPAGLASRLPMIDDSVELGIGGDSAEFSPDALIKLTMVILAIYVISVAAYFAWPVVAGG